jgi:RND superfamily putative drug exporter
VIRNAALAAPLAIAVLLLLAVPAVSLKTGPPSPSLLPKDSVARQDFEAIGRAMGPGWTSPFNVVVVSRRAPVTDKAILASMSRFQAGWAKDDRVASVVGPGPIADKADELNVLPKKLAESNKLLKGGKKELGKLQSGLGQAGAGVVTLRKGLQAAAAGAGQAGGGAGQLHAGLEQARAGAARISDGLHQALAGATRLRAGSSELLAGAKEINAGLGAAAGPVKAGLPTVGQMVGDVGAGYSAVQGASQSSKELTGQLAAAVAELQKMQAGKSDPAYQSALGALSAASSTANGVSGTLSGAQTKLAYGAVIAGGLQKKITELSGGLNRLYAGSGRLQGGIARLQAGNAELSTGIAALAGGGGDLTSGLSKLSAGAATLQAGLGTLSGKLSGGTGPAGELATGLGTAKSKVAKFRSDLPSPKDLEKLQKESPGLFKSGYFVLAAIDGAAAAAQTQPSFVVNLDRGGNAAQIAVVSRYGADDQRTQQLGDDLRDSAARFAATSATEAAVGGPAGELTDFASVTQSRIALVILALSAAIAVQLMLALRTIVLPLIAVAFDLLTAAAAFGVLAFLFSGDDPLLGGPGYIDPMSIIGIFAAIFGLTIVYEVMLLQRTREELLECGDAHQALRNALRPTAYAATGAALVALAAVGPFLATDLLAVRQFGVGLAVAVVLDAFIVRPVLLPAAVELLGRWGWWPTTRSAPVAPTLPTSPTPAV